MRQRLFRYLVYSLVLPLISFIGPVSVPAQAASETSQTITVKYPNGNAYSGALVQVRYYVNGDYIEIAKPVQTTNGSGQVTITYPSDAVYSQLMISPPTGDLSYAVTAIDLLTTPSSQLSDIRLKAASFSVKPMRPDGTEAGLGTCINYPKANYNRWITTQYRTVRTGAFGVYVPNDLFSTRDYFVEISPCSESDYLFAPRKFGLRKAANGSISLYSDGSFTTALSTVDGSYQLTFGTEPLTGELKNSDGTAFSPAGDSNIYVMAEPLNRDGTRDIYRGSYWSTQVGSDGKFGIQGSKSLEAGYYRYRIATAGQGSIPLFSGPTFWVNNQRQFSVTETGTYASSLNLIMTIPSTGLITFKVNFSDGTAAGSGHRISIVDKANPNSKASSLGNVPTNSQSKASIKVASGDYIVYVYPLSGYGINTEYSLSVTDTQTLVSDSAGANVAMSGDSYPLNLKTPNFKLQVVLPTDGSRPAWSDATLYSAKDGYSGPIGWLYMDSATTSLLKLDDGNYQLRVNEDRSILGYARKVYDVVVTAGNPVVKFNSDTVTAISGIYKLTPGAGVIAGKVLPPSGSEAIKFSRVELYKGSQPYPDQVQYTDVAGRFNFDVGYPPANGQYRLIAYPVLGVNAMQGVSDSVTVTVSNGAGSTNIEIRLKEANISGVVSGPTGQVSPENWLTITESKTTYSRNLNLDGPVTDKDGAYSLYLGTGKYEITPSSDYPNAKGVPGKPSVCTVGGNPAIAVTCDVKLETPTVTGTVSIGGAKPFELIVGLGASYLVETNTSTVKEYGTYWSDWTNENTYGLTVPAGTYRTWLSYRLYNGLQHSVPGPLCTVPATGTVTCDITLPATNVRVEAQDVDGSVIKEYASISIARREGTNYFSTCCTELNSNNNSILDGTINNGRADYGLLDGSYRLTISPSENAKGLSKSYFFDVVSGTATNMRTSYETTTYISAVDSIYRLTVEKALITGTIYDVDGVSTVKGGACFVLINSSGDETYSDCVYSSQGVFLVPSKIPVGNYTIYAYVTSTLTRANSSVASLTIDSNKTPVSINLRLNAPNVKGVAAGPTGVAIGAQTYVEKLNGAGNYVRINANSWTDSQGRFAFYLDPGTYRLTNNGDFTNSGGVKGTSSSCIVTSDTTTVVTCNITLPAPNVSGTVSLSGRDSIVNSVFLIPYYPESGTAGNGYYYANVSKNRFGFIANPGVYRIYAYYFNKQTGAGRNRVPTQLCVVPASGSVTCDATVVPDNLVFDVKTFDNTVPVSSITVSLSIRNGDLDKYWDELDVDGISGSERFSYPLTDGYYKLSIQPIKGTDGGRLSLNVRVAGGVVTSVVSDDSSTVYSAVNGVYTFNTKKPNLVGTATGPRGVIANTYIEVQQLVDGSLKWLGKGFNTDNLGQYALTLNPGTYQIKVFADYATTGASQTTIKCVIPDTSTVVTCDANLGAPNLTGTVKINGALVTEGSVLLEPNWSSASASKNSYGWLNFSAAGQYGTNAVAGDYVASIIHYPGSKWTIQPLGPCTVPETGTVTCNFTLPANNFKLQIKSKSGSVISEAYAHLSRKYGEGYQGPCCSSPRYSNSNQLEYALLDGSYQVRIWANSTSSGALQIFTFNVESGTVTNMKLDGSNTVISPAAGGVYQLQLSPPPFSGQVFKSNGTTPAPNSLVVVKGTKLNNWFYSDSEGKFSVDFGGKSIDENYTLQAFANRMTYNSNIAFDSSVANSIVITESLTAGVGNQNIKLILRAPNVQGRVSGVKGALKNRDIQVQQKDGLDNWNWIDLTFYTDLDGNYNGYLSPGTYRIFSNGDMRNSGGGNTYSSIFTIASETSTAQTINISLTPPNASGTLKANGVNIASGWMSMYRDYSVDNNTAQWYNSDIYNGGWGITAQAGTYILFANDYANNNGSSYAGRCVVPSSGSVICDYNLPAPNFIFKVKDTNGSFIGQSVYAGIEIVETSTAGYRYAQGTCCTSTDQVAQDGKIKLTLGSATYRIRVSPGNASIAGTSQSYIVKVESSTVKSVMREIDSVYIDSQTDTSYILQLQSPAISGVVYKPDNTTVATNTRVCIASGNETRIWWRSCTFTNSAGKFTFDNSQVSNGLWKVEAFPQYKDEVPDLAIGASTIDTLTVTNNVGSKTLRLVLRTPNVTGVVSGPLAVSSGNWINVRKYYDDGSFDYMDNFYMRTDSLGRFAFALDPGKYKIQAQDDMAKAGGTSALSADCIVVSGSNSTCNVALIAPNLSGLVRVGGVVTPASVEFIRQGVSSFENLGYYSGSNKSGQYWINIPAGTYRPRIYLYNQGRYALAPVCVVAASGSTTCNLDIPATNFKFKVTTSTGAVTSRFYINTYLKYSVTEMWAGNFSGSQTETITNTSLTDGSYRIWVEPYWEDRSLGSAQQYLVEVSGGVITSLKRDGNATPLVAVDGVYTLQMGVPSIAGSVVAPDSVTAVPYADVNAYLNPYNSYGAGADKVGAFSFNKLPDGTYSVIAFAPWGDATKAQSLPSTVTVSGGAGVTNLSLKLRTPNVTGVISGPLGVSKFNWINPEIKDSAGYWRTPDYTRGVASTAEGSFSFYLEPGIYRFRAGADIKNAGGSATISNTCTVPSSGSVTCNITMASPNVKLRIVEPGQTAVAQGSYLWADLFSAADWSAISNTKPQLDYNQDGNLQGYFEDGVWNVHAYPSSTSTYAQAQYRITVSGGVVTKVENESQETITATAGVYYLPLKASNITGTISANGSAFKGGMNVTAQRLEGNYFYHVANKWVDQGTFAFNLPAGTYRFEARPYWSNDGLDVTVTRSQQCEVPATGSVTCNFSLKSPNLLGLVVDDSSTAFRYVDAAIFTMNTDTSESWNQWLDNRDGYFKTYLPDGKYRIQINPYWNYRALYTERSYIITVSGDSITSIVDQTTNDTVTATDGIYRLRMGTPSVKGKVLIPGSETTGATNVDIRVAPQNSPTMWRYGANADSAGNFSLLLPNGTYVIQAFPYGSGFLYGKSETQTITVTNGALVGGALTLRLREPNTYGRVVTPQGAPLANVNVQLWMDGEGFYGWTGTDGRFSAFVDQASPNCPSKCSISLNYWASADYTAKSYTVSGKGNLGDLAIGGITSRLTVTAPVDGGKTSPNAYGFVSVLQVSGASRSWVSGAHTNQDGKLGLSLTQGLSYEITAFPGKEFVGKFAPKKLVVNSFDTNTMATLSISFPAPNFRVVVSGSDSAKNAQGWFTVSTWDSATSTRSEISGNYLNDDGKAALTLEDGTYKIRFWPGRSKGVQTELTVSVTSGVATVTDGLVGTDTFASSTAIFKLRNGNISGTIKDNTGAAVGKAVVAAYRSDDATKIVTTVADENGYFEINLDLTYTWDVKSLNPANSAVGQRQITSRSPSNATLTSQDITVAVAG